MRGRLVWLSRGYLMVSAEYKGKMDGNANIKDRHFD
jgi:hypothetical protein